MPNTLSKQQLQEQALEEEVQICDLGSSSDSDSESDSEMPEVVYSEKTFKEKVYDADFFAKPPPMYADAEDNLPTRH